MMRIFFTEWRKLRHRKIGLIYLAAFTVIFLWTAWCMRDMKRYILEQGCYYLLLNLPLMNAVFLPTILAAVESRLCDIELKGNTFKMLCTMQPRKSIYHVKLLIGTLYLLLFSLAETALIPLLCHFFHVQQPLPWDQLCIFFFSTFTVGLVLILIQQPLSLLFENQLFPLFFGLGGTFVGLFSWFFPQLPLRYLTPWGYYCVGATVNMLYDESTREMTLYTIPFPTKAFSVFLAFGLLVYLTGKRQFMKKEV